MTTIIRTIPINLTHDEQITAALELTRTERQQLFADVSAEISPVSLDLGAPIAGGRLWFNGWSPLPGGGGVWFGQIYNLNALNSTEWILMNDDGSYIRQEDSTWAPGQKGRFANTNYSISNQLRAANGRIFVLATNAWVYCYDPATNTVMDLGRIPSINGFSVTDAQAFEGEFSHDGATLFIGTQSANSQGRRPLFAMVDTNTLVMTPLARSQNDRTASGTTYVYYLRVDNGATPWIYGVIGTGSPFELVAVNVATGAVSTLESRAGYKPWITFIESTDGQRVRFWNGYKELPVQTFTEHWLADGVLYPYVPGQPPPFTPRDVTPYANPVTDVPDFDYSGVPRSLARRPHGSTGPWTVQPFSILYEDKIQIESLYACPDGSIGGEVVDKLGHFRHDTETGVLTTSDPNVDISDGDARCALSNGDVAMVGYANGVFLRYTPSQPYFAGVNPRVVGQFSDGLSLSGMKRGKVAAESVATNRLYALGYRERQGFGAGIGYCDLANETFHGHYNGLEAYRADVGMVVLDGIGRIIVGGTTVVDSGPVPPAQLIEYDQELVEIRRHTVVPGIPGTGKLFPSAVPNIVVGLTQTMFYRFDVGLSRLVKAVTFTELGALVMDTTTQCPAGIVGVIGTTLVLIDTETLRIADLGTVPVLARLAVQGSDVYAAQGTSLIVFRGVL